MSNFYIFKKGFKKKEYDIYSISSFTNSVTFNESNL